MTSTILIIIVFIVIDTALICTLIKQMELIESMQVNLDISKTEAEKQIEFAGKVQEENASLRSEIEDLEFDLMRRDRKQEDIIKILETNNYNSVNNLSNKIKTILAKN